ncbi:type II toxin-antitoxin system PemK/MazF family toxin [bacterium]|nr:type II toxin-antitoxin system PemK/MazF family toxin [bacterium]
MGLNDFPKRGEFFLVNLEPTLGAEINKTRPALIISNDLNNQYADTVTVIPITSATGKVYPFEVFIPSKESVLHKDSKIKCNQIRIIDKKRLLKRLGEIPSHRMQFVENAILIHLEIPNQ